MNSLFIKVSSSLLFTLLLFSCNDTLVLREVPVKDISERFRVQYNSFLALSIDSFAQTKSKKVKLVSKDKVPMNTYWVDEYTFEGTVEVKQNCYKIRMQDNLFFDGDVSMLSENEYLEQLAYLNSAAQAQSTEVAAPRITELNTGTPFKTWELLTSGEKFKVKGVFTLTSYDGKVVEDIDDLSITEFKKLTK